MTAEAWVWNDPEVPDDDRLMRRIRRKPEFRLPDLVTGRIHVKPAAIRIDPGSGLSTQSHNLLPLTGVERENVYNWETHNGIEFEAGAVRSSRIAGVVYEEDPDDSRLGLAHALVRADVPNPERQVRRDIQAHIASIAELMREDPNPNLGGD